MGLGLSLGYAIFSPKAPIPSAGAPPRATQQAAEPPAESNATPASVASVEQKPSPSTGTPDAAPTNPPEAVASSAAPGEPGYWAARHLFIALNGQWLADGTRELLRELRPGGVLLQDVNLGSRTQTFALVKEIKAAVGLGEGLGDLPLMAVQQEVGPYNLLGLENAPSAQTLGQYGDPELARKLGQEYGAACVGRGIAVAFAPVLDVFEPGAINPGFALRSFGTEHTLVARVGLAMADGLRQGGVLPVVKNFPGYGAATYGSDGLLVALNKDPAALGKLLYPFDQAVRRGVPGILVAHVAVPALDPEDPRRPAALSPVLVTELLRGRWGYEGVIVADDVALNPMTRTMGAELAAVQALAAGCDAVILLDPDPARIRAVSGAIAAAVERGTLSREKLQQSVARLTRWQEAIRNLNPIRATPEAVHLAEAVSLPIVTAPETIAPAIPAEPLPSTELRAAAETAAPPVTQPGGVETPPADAPETSAPAAETGTSEAQPAPSSPPATPGEASAEGERSRIEHRVGESESLADIARAYDVSVEDLKTWNALPSEAIAAGTKLTVFLGEGGIAPAPADAKPGVPVPIESTKESGPAPDPAPDSAPSSPPATPELTGVSGKAVYTVVEGDTLAGIAEKFHVAFADIKLWNGLDTDTVDAGAVLTIFLEAQSAPAAELPAPAELQDATPEAQTGPEPVAPAPDSAAATPPAPEIETQLYVVLAGDTVSKIAREHKTTNGIILTLNDLKNANHIVAGQQLKVPKLPS